MNFKQDIIQILSDFEAKLSKIDGLSSLEELRVAFLGKKGLINELFVQLKNVPAEEKKEFGSLSNQLRNQVNQMLEVKQTHYEELELAKNLVAEKLDLTAPCRKSHKGAIHPLSKAIAEIELILTQLGFEFAEGPEIEDDFHNFTALNMPQNHPARQMQDTFYLKNSDLLLRTHTSNTQIRKMLNSKPPLRVCSLGRVFRRDSDQTHTPMFHQLEGFVVDEQANMTDLKSTLERFLELFFESDKLKLRFRPSFFPFTEPSAEVDVNYSLEQGKVKIGNGNRFMEILGCGMIHPNVLRNCAIDDQKFQGFAFGVGIERLAMLKYGIPDLRMLFENDARFLDHYRFSMA